MTLTELAATAAITVTASAFVVGILAARRQPTAADQLAARRNQPTPEHDSGDAA